MHLDVEIHKRRVALKKGDSTEKCYLHYSLAKSLFRKHYQQRSKEALQECIIHCNHALQSRSPQLEVKVRKRLCLAYCELREFGDALTQSKLLKGIASSNDNSNVMGYHKFTRAFIRVREAKYVEDNRVLIKGALKDLKKRKALLDQCQTEKKQKQELQMELLTAELYKLKGKYSRAVVHYKKVADVPVTSSRIDHNSYFRQRLHYNLGKCYMNSFQFALALECFLLANSLALSNDGKDVLKNVNKNIGKCYCHLRQHAKSIQYFEAHLESLNARADLKVRKEIEVTIAKTKELVQYAQKYESEKRKYENLATANVQAHFLKYMVDLAKELNYDEDLPQLYLQLSELYQHAPGKLDRLYFDFEDIVLKVNSVTRDTKMLNTALDICNRHLAICSGDLDTAKVYITIGKLNELLAKDGMEDIKSTQQAILRAYVAARKLVRADESGNLILYEAYRCLRSFYKREKCPDTAEKYDKMMRDLESHLPQPSKTKKRTEESEESAKKQTAASRGTYDQAIDVDVDVDGPEVRPHQQITNFYEFILDFSKSEIGERPADKPTAHSTKEAQLEKMASLQDRNRVRLRKRRGAPIENADITDKDGNVLPVYREGDDWICNDIPSDEDDEEMSEEEPRANRGKRTLNEIGGDIKKKYKRIKKDSPKEQSRKKRNKNGKSSTIVISSDSDSNSDRSHRGYRDSADESPASQGGPKNYIVKLQGKSIPFTVDDRKQTAGALARQLEDHFRVESLTRMVISKLKVGKSPLLDNDLLEAVLNDGDVVIPTVEEVEPITILSLYKQTPSDTRKRDVERALEEEASKHESKHQISLTLNKSVSDLSGVALIKCLQGYHPLTSLDLSGNVFGKESEKELSVALRSLTNLRALSLSSNRFHGAVIYGISSLKSLKKLTLAFNPLRKPGFVALNEALGKCTNLESLDLQGTGLTSKKSRTLVNGFRSAQSLTSLSLSHNNLAPSDLLLWPIEECVAPLSKLTTLYMQNVGLRSEHCPSLARLLAPLSITNLNLANNRLENGILALCDSLASKIKILDLSNNNIGSSGGQSFASLIRRAPVSQLRLTGNSIGIDGVRPIAHAIAGASLIRLELAHCDLSYDGICVLLTALCHSKSLQHLDLGYNYVHEVNQSLDRFLTQVPIDHLNIQEICRKSKNTQ